MNAHGRGIPRLQRLFDPNKRQLLRLPLQRPGDRGGGALFTDFTFEALGVPRNANIPANVTHPGMPTTYYDLGLCTAQNPDP